MNKTLALIIGFALFIIGMMALVFSMVGIQFSFLTWVDAAGKTLGLLVKLLMVIAGVVITYLAQTDWEKERRELE